MKAKVLVPLAEGFEEMEAVNLIDVMRRGDVEVVVASVFAEEMIMGAHGIPIGVDMTLEACQDVRFDMIVLPGGAKGVENMRKSPLLMQLLKIQHQKERYLGAICAAPLVLAKEELLPTRFTCYPGVENDINLPGYDAESKIVMESNIMTSQGPGTAICMGIAIVKLLKGDKVAEAVSKAVLADRLC